MNDIIKRLAYIIYERRKELGFRNHADSAKNYSQAEDMINRILEDKEDISSLQAYLSEEDIHEIAKRKARHY